MLTLQYNIFKCHFLLNYCRQVTRYIRGHRIKVLVLFTSVTFCVIHPWMEWNTTFCVIHPWIEWNTTFCVIHTGWSGTPHFVSYTLDGVENHILCHTPWMEWNTTFCVIHPGWSETPHFVSYTAGWSGTPYFVSYILDGVEHHILYHTPWMEWNTTFLSEHLKALHHHCVFSQ